MYFLFGSHVAETFRERSSTLNPDPVHFKHKYRLKFLFLLLTEWINLLSFLNHIFSNLCVL